MPAPPYVSRNETVAETRLDPSTADAGTGPATSSGFDGNALPLARYERTQRVLIIYNLDELAGLTWAEWYVQRRGLTASYVGYSFGANGLGYQRFDLTGAGTRADFYTNLIVPAVAAQDALDPQAILLAPGVPLFNVYPDGSGSTNGSMTGLFALMKAIEDAGQMPDIIGSGATVRAFLYDSIPAGWDTTLLGGGASTSFKYSKQFDAWDSRYVRDLGLTVDRLEGIVGKQLVNKPLDYTFEFYENASLGWLPVGWLGAVKSFNESYLDTQTFDRFQEIVETAIANERSIYHHRDKPIFAGVNHRADSLSAGVVAAAVQMLRDAGFNNITTFGGPQGRGPDAAAINAWIGPEDISYSDWSTGVVEDQECWWALGHSFINEAFEDGGVGTALTNFLTYLPGSIAECNTSLSQRHADRCLKQGNKPNGTYQAGGCAGNGSRVEPTTGGEKRSLFGTYLLLNGLSMMEAVYYSHGDQFYPATTVGDPLYRPFGLEYDAPLKFQDQFYQV